MGRHTVLLNDSPTGPFTFYQLDSTSSQLMQKAYQTPLDFNPSSHVMEFLPQSRHSVHDIPPREVELVNAPFAELVVCLVRQRRCDSAAASTTSSHGAVTRVLWYDPDTLSIAAECDVSGKVSENDVCIFCHFCGLVALIGCGDTAHTSDGCKSSRVTAWSPYTPATPIQLSVTPFCPSNDQSVHSFLAGLQEGECAAVQFGKESGICPFHRIVQCVVEGYTATKLYSVVLTTQARDCAKFVEAGEERIAELSFHWPCPRRDGCRVVDTDPSLQERMTAVLSFDNLIVKLYGIAIYDNKTLVRPEILVDVDIILPSSSSPYFYNQMHPLRCFPLRYDGIVFNGPVYTLAKGRRNINMITISSTMFGREIVTFGNNHGSVFLWDYNLPIASCLPRPEGLVSESPMFIHLTKPAIPRAKYVEAHAGKQ